MTDIEVGQIVHRVDIWNRSTKFIVMDVECLLPSVRCHMSVYPPAVEEMPAASVVHPTVRFDCLGLNPVSYKR